jgi:histidinol-phosphatase (PHP family)
MITTDYHMHSRFSHDGKASVDEMCEAAAAWGLTEICFTEHFDFDPGEPRLDLDAYTAAVAAARVRFAGRLTIRLGVEFDFRRAYGPQVGEVVGRLPADFLIGSVHTVAGYRLYRLRKGVPAGFDARAVLAEYFAEVEALASSGWCDALGHFDYLYKQVPGIFGPLRDGAYWQKVEGILRRCRNWGVAIEVNTHHTLQGCAMAADVEILRRYHAMGGRLVTVGSDAHRPGDVAHDFASAEAALRQAGFDHVCGYEQGRLYFVPIG